MKILLTLIALFSLHAPNFGPKTMERFNELKSNFLAMESSLDGKNYEERRNYWMRTDQLRVFFYEDCGAESLNAERFLLCSALRSMADAIFRKQSYSSDFNTSRELLDDPNILDYDRFPMHSSCLE